VVACTLLTDACFGWVKRQATKDLTGG